MNGDVDQEPDGLVAAYKRRLQAVCDNRPSGTRGRLAAALGTNRSFISQLVSPGYTMPIPPQHIETIFEVCHFSQAEREAFLQAYDRAHPGRRPGPARRQRQITVSVPDLGNAGKNQAIEEMVGAYVEHLARMIGVFEG